MSESSDVKPRPWFVKRQSSPTGTDDITQLGEAELQRLLTRAGDGLNSMFVKQGNSEWYPASVVLKKFEQLANEGIYVRRHGKVDGPFTANKAVEVLAEMDLDAAQAKVGIHADWVSARRLLIRLQMIQEGLAPSYRQDDPDDASEEPILEADLIDDEIIDAQAIDDQPLIELIMVAEPVALPQKPRALEPVRRQRPTTIRQRPTTIRQPPPPPPRPPQGRAKEATSNRSSYIVLLVATGVLALMTFIAGIVFVVINRGSTAAIAESSDAASPGGTNSQDSSVLAAAAPVEGPPPRVLEGTLYRPTFRTSMGEAKGGTLFSARIGRSKRMVLVGAAHLLGPATGLKRQLRGAEVLMHWESMEVTDCVSGNLITASGKPLRLRTSEYPSISVHGDAFVFEPDKQMGLEPLAIASTLPNVGDRVWLLAPAIGTESLVHGGRWIGNEDDWLLYRLDNQNLNLVGTSGGALVNVDHQVIGIHVAAGESNQGVISIASPVKAIIPEIQ